MRHPTIASIVVLGFCVGPIASGAPAPASPGGVPAPSPTAAVAPGPSPAPAPVVMPRRRLLGRFLSAPAAEVPPAPARPRDDAALPTIPGAGRAPTAKAPLRSVDPQVRRAQSVPGAIGTVAPPDPNPGAGDGAAFAPTPSEGGRSLSLQAALYGALTGNPDLAVLRQGGNQANAPSEEAVEVARHFPSTLNPTIWLDYRPITLIPNGTFGGGSPGGSGNTGSGASHPKNYYSNGQGYLYLSYRQPLELGHQTTHRYNIAKAALNHQRWTVVQAELTALVQTYRFFQTAAYRREKLRVAQELSEFNDRLIQTLQRRLAANQGLAADVTLAKVESRATRQLAKAARQDYMTALTDLRNQIGAPESAGTAEPLGEFTLPSYIPPIDEDAMIREALQGRPDIHAARAMVNGSCSSVKLARADVIPNPIVGPQYEQDEAGVQYIGFVYITPLPILNTGRPLVRQREAEHRRAVQALQRAEQRAVAQVRAAVAKWNGAKDLVDESSGLTRELAAGVDSLERLFEAGQTDLTKLIQARQRLIQLENAQLDATWQATQAQADLLLALGAPTLIDALRSGERGDAAAQPVAPSPPAPTAAGSPFQR